MSLYSDLKEKVQWNELSTINKVLYGVSLLFTVSSVTSLADVVFHWKGFILDGVHFYRDYIRSLFSVITLPFDLHFDPNMLDGLTISLILLGGALRVKRYWPVLFFTTIFTSPMIWWLGDSEVKTSKIHGKEFEYFFMAYMVMNATLAAVYVLLGGSRFIEKITLILLPFKYFYLPITYLIFKPARWCIDHLILSPINKLLIFCGVLKTEIKRPRIVNYSNRERILFLSIPALALIFVLILGAINTGLTRTV